MRRPWVRLVVLMLHWMFILYTSGHILYISYVFFVVLNPGSGILFGEAASYPYEDMMIRRAYANEGWIAWIGLMVYLALTEIGPRLLAWRLEDLRAQVPIPPPLSETDPRP